MCVCFSDTSITQKQIEAEIPNRVFYIFIIWRGYLKLFMKIVSVKRHIHTCTQEKKKRRKERKGRKKSNTLRPMKGISFLRILIYLDCTNYNKINAHFWHAQKSLYQQN